MFRKRHNDFDRSRNDFFGDYEIALGYEAAASATDAAPTPPRRTYLPTSEQAILDAARSVV
ncbi:MAG: hypothetical protein D6763_09890 [Alphaproteobacteria bacterium]|nr:MAG: hypothetical protein D6763_09890 [Alphaproteobacteria bacterium]